MQREELLQEWCTGVRIAHVAHEKAAARYDAVGRLLGVIVVVLSTIVGTAIFSTLARSPSTALKVVTGVLSTAAAAVAGVQALLGYPQRAADHREAAMRYGTLRRHIEQLQAFPPGDIASVAKAMENVAEQWDDVDAAVRPVPQPIWDQATAHVRQSQERASQARAVHDARPATA